MKNLFAIAFVSLISSSVWATTNTPCARAAELSYVAGPEFNAAKTIVLAETDETITYEVDTWEITEEGNTPIFAWRVKLDKSECAIIGRARRI